MVNKLEAAIGLCQKAGKLVSGSFLVLEAIRSGKAKLVIISNDSSDNTKKRITDKCKYYNVTYFEYADMKRLGKVIGKEERTTIAILDKGFAKLISDKIEETVEAMR